MCRQSLQGPRRAIPGWLLAWLLLGPVCAQEPAVGAFRRPPEAIARLVEAPPPPATSLSPQRRWLVFTEQEALPGLAVVARPHEKLAGLRIDPRSRGPQLGVRTLGITLRNLESGAEHRVDVPAGHWSGPLFSADDRAFVLWQATEAGLTLWVADPATATPRQVPLVVLNEVLGPAVRWLPDQQRLCCLLAVPGEPPARPATPAGPQVQEARAGEKATVRTYQDLLQDSHDELRFEHFATSQLAVVDPQTGSVQKVGAPALYDRVEPSPDGTLLLAEILERPFSFVVPASQFPRRVVVLDWLGARQRLVVQRGLLDQVPIGGVPTGPRAIDWVPTLPHTLQWTEALDGGDPRRVAEQRDRVLLLAEPNGEPVAWFTTEHRTQGVQFAAEAGLALVTEFDRRTRRQRLWRHDWLDPSRPGVLLRERSTQDAYGDPGRPITERTQDGRTVLRSRAGALFLVGDGASPTGNRPFVASWQPDGGATARLFECAEGRHETFVGYLDASGQRLLIRSESPSEPPALVVVELGSGQRSTLVKFPDPAADFVKGVEKRLLAYQREDGVPLSGTLYLPPGTSADARVPCLLWAYPQEFTSATDAGQVRAAPNRYLRLGGASHLLLLAAGYAVFDDAAMPIVGPVRTANDTFVSQVQQNARAAVHALEATGRIDVRRIAVAGHSYGAFMTANLLAHTDLFCAGIARSGAYNRTLTPFGFQNEERTYWEAPEVYHAMSPFSFADRIREPLLLIHGADDNNPGTFPVQSQRLFAAIKGHGGTARLCMLPNESHGYRSREGVLHCLHEMVQWLDRHCREPR